jgi:hypothetical protein
MTTERLILKRASASRPSGEWNEDDFDVLANSDGATFRGACERWPGTPITLRQGARVIEDSRRLRVAWSDKGRHGGR